MTIGTRTQGAAERLSIAVADTGIGIAPEMTERLFEPFVQADSTYARRFAGLGLGLAICRLLVEAMGGAICVDSTLGAGSTFIIDLPLRRPARASVTPLRRSA